jgi:hypothetical protein
MQYFTQAQQLEDNKHAPQLAQIAGGRTIPKQKKKVYM